MYNEIMVEVDERIAQSVDRVSKIIMGPLFKKDYFYFYKYEMKVTAKLTKLMCLFNFRVWV